MSGLTKDDLKEQLDWYSSSITSVVRTTCFAVIAAIWAIFTADGLELSELGLFGIPTEYSVRSAFIFASLAMLFDIIQYVFAYWMTYIGYGKYEAELENDPSKEFYYNRDDLGFFGNILYHTIPFLFSSKLVFSVGASVCFVILVFGVKLD